MLQFYFLSILLNALAGYILISSDRDSVLEFKGGFSLNDETFRLIVGILSVLTGLMKVLSAVDVPVIGDLFPGIIGFLAGFILLFEYYQNRASVDTEQTEKISRTLIANKRIIGTAALIAAVLHFLFPGVLLL